MDQSAWSADRGLLDPMEHKCLDLLGIKGGAKAISLFITNDNNHDCSDQHHRLFCQRLRILQLHLLQLWCFVR